MIRRLFILNVFLLMPVMLFSAKQGASNGQPQKGNVAAQTDAAVIENSGSTNTPGYRLSIDASGQAEWTLFRRRNSPGCSQNKARLSPELVQQFFANLRQLAPLAKIPSGRCIKSISFGSTLRVSYRGMESPDLSCSTRTSEVEKLLADIDKIKADVGISANIKSLPPACDSATTTGNH